MRNKRFKIGVLYARPGQTTEDEIYGNGALFCFLLQFAPFVWPSASVPTLFLERVYVDGTRRAP